MSHTQQTRRCSFCNRGKRDDQVFAGADVWICASCVAVASDIFEHTRSEREGSHGQAALRCSFCRKSERELNKLCAGPNVYICDGCVGAAAGTLPRPRSHVRYMWSAVLRRVRGWIRRATHYQSVEAS